MLTKTILKTTLALFASLSLFLLGPTDPDKPKLYEPLDTHLKVLEQTYVAADGHCDPGAQNLMILRLQAQNVSPDLLLSEITPEILFEHSGKVVSISQVEGSVEPGETFTVITKIVTRDCDPAGISVRFKGKTEPLDPTQLAKGKENKGEDDNNNDNDDCSEDQVPPVALCDNISVFLDASGNASITPGDVDGGSYDNFWLVDWSVSPHNFDCNDLGVNVVTLTVEDCNGNTGSCQATVTVVDQTAPTITNYALDLTVECDGMGNLADLNPWLANQGGATVSDACGPITWTNDFVAVTNGCTNSSPTGTAQVNFTATDGSGNSTTVGATFLIVDTQAPVITCPANVTTLTVANSCQASVSFAATATDDCDATPNITYSVAPGSWFSLGTTTVTATAKDECSNLSVCSFTIEIQDSIPPTLYCAGDTTIQLFQCADSVYLPYPTPSATDNCAIQSLTNDYTGTSDASGIYYPGLTVVTWTAVDSSGNSTTCTDSIIVVQAPGYTRVCDISDDILEGETIQVAVLAPQAGADILYEWESIPLIVEGKDFDNLLQTCQCLCLDPNGVPVMDSNAIACQSQSLITIRDQVNYYWEIVSGPGTLRATDRPATILDPPPIGGTPFTTTVRVTVGDSRNNDTLATATFVIDFLPEGPCEYTRIISHSTMVSTPAPVTISSDTCDCNPLPPVWTVGDSLTGQITASSNQMEACSGSKILVFAKGEDRDSLKLTCAGACGIDSAEFHLVDEPVYFWTAHGGSFPDYGGISQASTSSTETAVVWQAPDAPGTYLITVQIVDGFSQFLDQVVTDTIEIIVKDVEIDFVGLHDTAETCVGGILCLNDDDDNLNNVVDLNEIGPIQDENELMPIMIDKQPGMGTVDIAIAYSGQGRIELWEDSLKTVHAATSYPASAMPLELWVEGTQASVDGKDILVTVSCGNGLPCADSLRLTVIAVVDMFWSGERQGDGQTNFEPGGNPAQYGGGDRIYPGRNYLPGTPGGLDDLHNVVNVVAVLSAPLPLNAELTIHFRLFDPDHYSMDADYDPNGIIEPNDNLEAGPNPLAPELSMGALLFDQLTGQPDTAITFLGLGSVSAFSSQMVIGHLQPGNNWIAIADCKGDAVSRVGFDTDGQTLKAGPGVFAPNWPLAKQSGKITVWRKLYYEYDRMEDPEFETDDAGRSQFRSTGSGNVVRDVTTGRIQLLNTNSVAGIVPGQTNQFINGGMIELLINPSVGPNFWVDVAVLSNSTGVNPWITPAYAVGNVIRWRNLRDDDITTSSPDKIDTSEDMGPSYMFDLWESKLEPALITPIDTSTQVNSFNDIDVEFRHHIGDIAGDDLVEIGEVRDIIAANKQTRSEFGFWLIYQLGAFQGRIDEEYDPGFPFLPITGGISSGTLGLPLFDARNEAEAGTLIYAESSREWANQQSTLMQTQLQVTSIHEAGHQFGCMHLPSHGDIMFTPSNSFNLSWEFGPGAYRYMMTTFQPGFSAH